MHPVALVLCLIGVSRVVCANMCEVVLVDGPGHVEGNWTYPAWQQIEFLRRNQSDAPWPSLTFDGCVHFQDNLLFLTAWSACTMVDMTVVHSTHNCIEGPARVLVQQHLDGEGRQCNACVRQLVHRNSSHIVLLSDASLCPYWHVGIVLTMIIGVLGVAGVIVLAIKAGCDAAAERRRWRPSMAGARTGSLRALAGEEASF